MDCDCICICPKCGSENVEMELIDQDYAATEFHSEWEMKCSSCNYKWKRIEYYELASVKNEEL